MIPIREIMKNLKGEKETFNWTPKLTCYDSSETSQMQVDYEQQSGRGCKIRIKEGFSIVFITFNIRAFIKAVSPGNNYSRIGGLPYGALDLGALNFGQFSFGIDNSHPAPSGNFSGKAIQVLTQRSGMDKWVATPTSRTIINGSGFYFTNE